MDKKEEFERLFLERGRSFSGSTGLVFQRLDKDIRFAYQQDRLFPTASVIKLFVLGALLERCEEGLADWYAPARSDNPEEVAGTGILRHLEPGLTVRVCDLAVLMTALSDNVATNRLIDVIGSPEAVNAHIRRRGLQKTTLNRKVSGKAESTQLGVSTPGETADYLRKVYDSYLEGDSGAHRFVSVLGKQLYTNAFVRKLPLIHPSVQTANKTGMIPGVRCDAGLLFEGERAAVYAAFTDGCRDGCYHWDNEADVFLGDVGELCVTWLFDGQP